MARHPLSQPRAAIQQTQAPPAWVHDAPTVIPIESSVCELDFADHERDWLGVRAEWPKAKVDVEMGAVHTVDEGLVP